MRAPRRRRSDIAQNIEVHRILERPRCSVCGQEMFAHELNLARQCADCRGDQADPTLFTEKRSA